MNRKNTMNHKSQFKAHISRNKGYQKQLFKFISIIFVVSLTIIACNNTPEVRVVNSSVNENTLNIWWDKGFSPEEDEALGQLVRNWENKTGKEINLLFYTTDSLGEKIRRSLKAGNSPDIVMSFKAERSPNARLAWDDKLVDVSDIINPIKNLYTEPVLETVNFYNNVKKKRSYYAIPIHQGTMHIYYRRDLLEEAGLSEKDIPKDWDAFWNFWKQVQDDLIQKGFAEAKSYSIGQE